LLSALNSKLPSPLVLGVEPLGAASVGLENRKQSIQLRLRIEASEVALVVPTEVKGVLVQQAVLVGLKRSKHLVAHQGEEGLVRPEPVPHSQKLVARRA